MRQSEVTKSNFESECLMAKTMCQSVTCSGPYPTYSKLLSLNHWLAEWCASNFNWQSFWGRDSVHPSCEGTALISRRIASSFNSWNWLFKAKAWSHTICPTQMILLNQHLWIHQLHSKCCLSHTLLGSYFRYGLKFWCWCQWCCNPPTQPYFVWPLPYNTTPTVGTPHNIWT